MSPSSGINLTASEEQTPAVSNKKSTLFFKTMLLVILAVLLAAVLFFCFQPAAGQNKMSFSLAGHDLQLEIARTPAQQVQGLSGRAQLDWGQGMLFVYDGYVQPGFWMKDMNFSLDIIWIRDLAVVDISKNLPPEGETPQNHYFPSVPVNLVLEVPAGYIDDNDVKIGDRLIAK